MTPSPPPVAPVLAATPDAPPGPRPSPRGRTILVIDDDPVVTAALSGMLGGDGFAVLAAADGPQGRRLARNERPDIILLDLIMPGESGLDTCVRLKADPATAAIPVLFISGSSETADKVAGLEAGAVDYITKPFARAEVAARVRRHLSVADGGGDLAKAQAERLASLRGAQRSMLVTPAKLRQARFAVRYLPVLEAGGDFYDVFETPAGFGYFVADICGHDLGASLVTSSLKALLTQNISLHEGRPREIVQALNDVLCCLCPPGRFVTAQLAWLDRARQTLTVVDAGHVPPVLVPVGAPAGLLAAGGDVLGAFPDIRLEVLTLPVQPGDRVIMYSDGLIERFHGARRGRKRGFDLLVAQAEASRHLPLEEALDIVHAELTGRETLTDDIVILGFDI